jgi:hypothetical protein
VVVDELKLLKTAACPFFLLHLVQIFDHIQKNSAI